MSETKDGFVTWSNSAEFAKASAAYSKAQESILPINRSVGSISNRWRNIDSNTSIRDSYSRLDYEFFRPNEATPKRHKEIIGACFEAYKKVAVVKQVVDMLSEFCSKGARLVHRDKSIENFHQIWFKHVSGPERSERFASLFYKGGNNIVKRSTAIIDPQIASQWKRSIGQEELSFPNDPPTKSMEIPIRYTFLNPTALEVLGGELAAFTGQFQYALRLPNQAHTLFDAGVFGEGTSFNFEDIPLDLKNAIKQNKKYIQLDSSKLSTFFYKKDDWEVWAYPMLYSLLDDLIYLQKMKLADLTALDGIISHIRIWKLGSIEHKILPTDAAISKLSNILLNHVAGGSMDFIWGPDLTIEETSTDLYKFLGSEKYNAVVSSIHNGLGIPASFTGTSGSFSNNFMSLRTIIERLSYGRQALVAFWDQELRLLQKAMGFRYPAQIVFDNMNFNDETSEKALWIQLVDRNLISEESVQEKFGQIPEIEKIRIAREEKERESKQMPTKVSPYHDAQPQLSLSKIALQGGSVAPSQVGLELMPKKAGEKTALQMKQPKTSPAPEAQKPIGVAGQGRPLNKKDSVKRKQKIVKPNAKADYDEFVNLTLYANQVQKLIHDSLAPYFLEKFEKSNLRQLTHEEEAEFDYFKHCLLYNIEYADVVNEDIISHALVTKLNINHNAFMLYNTLVQDFISMKGKEPTYEDIRQLRNLVYASIRGEYDHESENINEDTSIR